MTPRFGHAVGVTDRRGRKGGIGKWTNRLRVEKEIGSSKASHLKIYLAENPSEALLGFALRITKWPCDKCDFVSNKVCHYRS